MADFYIKQGDTLPRLGATLKKVSGAPINLTGATVTFKMRSSAGGSTKVSAVATVLSAAGGTVEYAWQEADTDTEGQFDAEWIVDWGAGLRQRVPNSGFFTVAVLAGIP